MTLQTLPDEFDYGDEDGDEVVEAEWQKHKGWWLSGGDDDCIHCDAIIPEGRPIFLTGEVGVMFCEHHAPVDPTKDEVPRGSSGVPS